MIDKNKMNKVGLFAMTVALSSVVAACSSGSSDSGSSNKTTPSAGTETPKAEQPKEREEIVIYAINGDTPESFEFRFGEALRKKFPEYDFKYIHSQKGSTLTDMITTKTRFDITYHASGFYENFLIPNGLEYDMTETLKAQKVDLSRYEQTAMDTINQIGKGKLYSLPVYGNNTILYYNKSIFDKFGTAYPTNNLTWAQMTELSKKLTRQDAGTQYYGFGFTPHLFTRMNPMSIPTIDLKTNAPTINTNDLWKKYIDRVFVEPFPQPGAFQTLVSNSQFVKDKNVAMMAYLSSYFTLSIEDLKQVDWDVVPLPSFDEKPGIGSQINSINFGVTSIAKNKEAATKVVAYMGSDEFQMGLSKKGIMPVLKNQQIRDAIGTESVFKDKNLKAAVFAKQPAPVPEKTLYDADMITIYANYGLEVWKGTMDVNTAMRKAEEEAKKKIEEHIASGRYK